MKRIINQHHSRQTLYILCSRLLERVAYCGLRSILLLFLIKKILLVESNAKEITGWLISYIILSRLIGAVLGDLLLGNRNAAIIGGMFQCIGGLLLCCTHINSIHVGVIFIALGTGFHNPNIDAYYGKNYLDKDRLLDSAFVLLNMAINLGSFIGTVTIIFLSEQYGYRLAIILIAVLFLLSAVILYSSTRIRPSTKINKQLSQYFNYTSLLLSTIIGLGLFWAAMELAKIDPSYFQALEIDLMYMNYFPIYIDALVSTFLGLLILWVWTKYYRHPLVKIIIGLLFGALSLALFYLTPIEATTAAIPIYILAILFLFIAEIYTIPVLRGLIVRLANPKYLATVLSLAFLPSYLFIEHIPFFNVSFDSYYETSIVVSISYSALFALFMFFLYRRNKNLEIK